MKPRKQKSRIPGLLRHGVLAWLVAVTVETLVHPASLSDLSAFDSILPLRLVAIAAMVFIALTALDGSIRDEIERWAMVGTFTILAATYLCTSFTWPFLAVCLFLLVLLLRYAQAGWNATTPQITPQKRQRRYGWLTAGLAVAFFLLVSAWTVGRVRSFNTPTFDFGIFAQMFHSMKTTGLPVTTVERDGALSHFAVHVSPIYYLLLPFYCLFPKPETLQVLQAAVLASAVIPLWKIAKSHGLHAGMCTLVCAMLLLYPAYAGGTSYDIHENAFLTPLILWLLYAVDQKKSWLSALFALLTLMVKEDAAVYVAVVALYLFLRGLLGGKKRWDLIAGGVMLLGAIAWFLVVTGYLAKSGDGVMTYRYQNFMYDGSGSLITVVKAVLLCPMKAVFECVDKEKLEFIALTLLPLAGLPLLTRRYERYILLIPYVLVNLMSDYQYQHDIFFQYTYGATACLFYLTVVNLADIHVERRRLAAAAAALCISAGCFSVQILPVALRYPSYCRTYQTYYGALRTVLDEIPEGESVAATTFYTTFLSQRDTLYDIRYASREHVLSCSYMAINPSDSKSFQKYAKQTDSSGYAEFVALLESQGYEKCGEYEGRLELYRRK